MRGEAGTFSQKRAAPLLRGLYENCAFGAALTVFGIGGLVYTAVGPLLYVICRAASGPRSASGS
jgi:hypothetical protein